MRLRTALSALAVATATVGHSDEVRAQTPLGAQPKVAVEVITLKSVKIENAGIPVSLRYLRAGTAPQQYRAGVRNDLSDGVWTSLTESNTQVSVVDGITWVSGQLKPPGGFTSAENCGKNILKRKVFLQFRGVNKSQVPLLSNIASDTLCLPIG
jgi:hypothetical protein